VQCIFSHCDCAPLILTLTLTLCHTGHKNVSISQLLHPSTLSRVIFGTTDLTSSLLDSRASIPDRVEVVANRASADAGTVASTLQLPVPRSRAAIFGGSDLLPEGLGVVLVLEGEGGLKMRVRAGGVVPVVVLIG
jgi:hypothetical protein